MREAAIEPEMRARFHGWLEWICPGCGHFNRTRLHWTSWKAQCNGQRCRRVFVVGLTFLFAPRGEGSKALPKDYILPAWHVRERWHPGKPVHMVVGMPHDEKVPQGS